MFAPGIHSCAQTSVITSTLVRESEPGTTMDSLDKVRGQSVRTPERTTGKPRLPFIASRQAHRRCSGLDESKKRPRLLTAAASPPRAATLPAPRSPQVRGALCVTMGYQYALDFLASKAPQISRIVLGSPERCMRLVAEGEVEAYMDDDTVVNWRAQYIAKTFPRPEISCAPWELSQPSGANQDTTCSEL